jgi:hypothetical protein
MFGSLVVWSDILGWVIAEAVDEIVAGGYLVYQLIRNWNIGG